MLTETYFLQSFPFMDVFLIYMVPHIWESIAVPKSIRKETKPLLKCPIKGTIMALCGRERTDVYIFPRMNWIISYLWTSPQSWRWLWWGRGSPPFAHLPWLKKTVQASMTVFPFQTLSRPVNKNILMHLCSGKCSLRPPALDQNKVFKSFTWAARAVPHCQILW